MPDYRVSIEIRDVARGDVKGLVDEIMETHGNNFDAARGDFTIKVAESDVHGGAYFPIDLDEED